MEYYYVVANYMGCHTFMWSGKFNNNSLESQGIFIIRVGTLIVCLILFKGDE